MPISSDREASIDPRAPRAWLPVTTTQPQHQQHQQQQPRLPLQRGPCLQPRPDSTQRTVTTRPFPIAFSGAKARWRACGCRCMTKQDCHFTDLSGFIGEHPCVCVNACGFFCHRPFRISRDKKSRTSRSMFDVRLFQNYVRPTLCNAADFRDRRLRPCLIDRIEIKNRNQNSILVGNNWRTW